MNRHALSVLEFSRVLDEVAARASSELGAERIRQLIPGSERSEIERDHARIGAVRALRDNDPPWHAEPVPDLRSGLERLRVAGLSWNAVQFQQVLTLLRAARKTRDVLRDDKRPAMPRALLESVRDRLLVNKDAETAIDRCIADDATVKDGASPALKRLRRDLRASEGELVRLLERQLERLDESQRVPDMSVTIRNGRYVIPVRREGRHVLGGIVHDTSASGATVFVEPPAAVEFGNRIRELEVEEREEVERILAELTEVVRPMRDELAASLEALVELDTLHARAAYAMATQSAPPAFVNAGQSWFIAQGRHPLLLARGVDAVPFDLTMEASERTVVVSGPNTGGKTVLLKAVGLLCAMAQAGVPPTLGAGSVLPIFDDYFADVGDEQSIEASLSTFSAHLRNLAEILASASSASLVLIDELGSGTDPQEGAALGWAMLEELNARGTTTVATSHLGVLKELATEVPGVVNASLQFDVERLTPTYRFTKGIPGRSYGISIARKLRLPENVVERAEQRMPRTERDVAALLERLEQQDAALKARDAELAAMQDDVRARAQDVARRERSVRERERRAERESRAEARTYLLNARAEIDRTVRELKKSSVDRIDAEARLARKHAEHLAARQASIIDQLDAEEQKHRERSRARSPAREQPAAGDFVRVATLNGRPGRVMEIREGNALVAVGSVKMTIPIDSLEKRAPDETESAVSWHGDFPEERLRSEVDLRGLRGDDLDAELLRALDDAIRVDLPALRIIHGKGTGALRERVTELLRKDVRVKNFRLGAWNEGGAGVTIAELG